MPGWAIVGLSIVWVVLSFNLAFPDGEPISVENIKDVFLFDIFIIDILA